MLFRLKAALYHDFYFRVISCIIGAHIIVAYAIPLSIFQMLLDPYYYYALIPSFVIAIILFSIIRTIHIRLDRKFDWTERPIQRIAMQTFFGFVLPGLCAFLLAALYFFVRGRNIFNTTYLTYDFQFILTLLLLINVYYIAYHFYARWSQAQKIISAFTHPMAAGRQTFQVTKGQSNILLPIEGIAYFFREGESNYLRTFNGENYFMNATLDEVQQQLPEKMFFRANRQLIIQRQACKGYDLLDYGKLNVRLEPPLAVGAAVSQKRAKDFKQWIDKDVKNHFRASL
jgi:hypothetical protein